MTTITVERTEDGILVSEAETMGDAAWVDPLPPLAAARYLHIAPDAIEGVRRHDLPLIESIRPYAQSTLVALEPGFGSAADGEETPPAQRLAAELGVTIVAPEGRFISSDGALFAVGPESSWIAYSPVGTKLLHGRRYPEPAWQTHLPRKIAGTAQIPAGLWITDRAEATHAVHLADIAVHPQQLLIVVGSPGTPAPGFARIRDVLRELPEQTRASAVLIGYGDTSLDQETIRLLAAELQQPLRVAHGVTISGRFVRLGPAHGVPTETFARESVCTPDGIFEIERWSAPLGMANVSGNTYRFNDEWVVDVVPAGLVLRPAHVPSNGAGDTLPDVSETLTVMLCGDGADRLKRVIPPLRRMLEKLHDYAATQLIPGDRAARRLIRNAFPGSWAPTARLAVTDDGRIIAAAVDENEIDPAEEQRSQTHDDDNDLGQELVADHDTAAAAADASETETPVAVKDEEDTSPVGSPSVSHGERVEASAHSPVMTSTYAPDVAPIAADSTQPVMPPLTTYTAIVGGTTEPIASSAIANATSKMKTKEPPSRIVDTPAREADDAPSAPVDLVTPREARQSQPQNETRPDTRAFDASGPIAAIAHPGSDAPHDEASNDPSDALARALRGSAATAGLLAKSTRSSAFDAMNAISGGGRGSVEPSLPEVGTESAPQTSLVSADAVASPHPRTARAEPVLASDDAAASVESDVAKATLQNAQVPEPAVGEPADNVDHDSEADELGSAGVDPTAPTEPSAQTNKSTSPPLEAAVIEVPRDARSTAEQRHRVRSALGTRYDVASRSVSQLLAQQPGMRVISGDRSTLLTTLSVVSVFAEDPTARYDIDFHTCLAEGLAALPTTRSIVVRGLPEASTAPTNAILTSGIPFISASVDAPLTGPMEALIWTTTGRRLDRLMGGNDAATDIILPAHTQLRVLGTADGTVPRLLLAEAGVNDDNVLSRLHDAAASRDEGIEPFSESRWLGEPLMAV